MGMLKYMQGVLFSFGRETYKDAIIDIPEFYHSAVIYSRLYSELYSRSYSFFSPVDAGQLQDRLKKARAEAPPDHKPSDNDQSEQGTSSVKKALSR